MIIVTEFEQTTTSKDGTVASAVSCRPHPNVLPYYGQKIVIVGYSTRTNRDFAQRGPLRKEDSEKVLISRPAVHRATENDNEDGMYVDKPRSGRPR